MPKATSGLATTDAGVIHGHHSETSGYTVGPARCVPLARLLHSLGRTPAHRCEATHWGVVLKGRVRFHTADGHETISAGEAYYVGPGHTPELFPDTEVIEFIPTPELARTLAIMAKSIAAA